MGEAMLHFVIPENYGSLLALAGIIFAFAVTVAATAKLADMLPKDGGREFAHDGKLSAGKPRGAGIIFVLAFAAAAYLFAPMKPETAIYLILTIICMMTGFLDDSSKMPWGEYKKGFLDLCVAALVAMTFLKYNPNTGVVPCTGDYPSGVVCGAHCHPCVGIRKCDQLLRRGGRAFRYLDYYYDYGHLCD